MWFRVLLSGLARIAVLVALIAITSCASRTHISFDPEFASAKRVIHTSTETDPRFVYPPDPIEADDQLTDENSRYEIRRLSFPSIGGNGQIGNLVTVDYHRSKVPGAHPVVIVLPIWGRHVYPSNAIVRTLRKRSNGRVHVLNVLGTDFLIDWPKLGTLQDENEFLDTWREGADHEMATLVDIRRLIDWAEEQTEIDGSRVGLIGFSHGAMFAPALAAQEARFSATILVMGGADPHDVIARCMGARTEGVQDHAFEVFGWTRDEMASILEPVYAPMNASNYPNRVDPARVLIFDAAKDECVPKSARDALWEAMGRPERYIINANHRHAFYTMTPLNFNWMRKRIWDFVESRLLEGSAYSDSDRQ